MNDEDCVSADEYARAVEAAGIVELPDTDELKDQGPDLLAGRFEDDESPGTVR